MRPNNRLGFKKSQNLSYREPVSRIVIPFKKNVIDYTVPICCKPIV